VSAPEPNSAEHVVSVRGLFKSYSLGESRVEVLTGLDLEVRRGELTAVMGPSGVGKSTLLNCLAGLDTADRGQVALLGHDLAALDDHGRTLVRRRHLGIIYQFFNLVPNLDVEENVVLPYLIEDEAPDAAAVERALSRVGMLHRRHHLPAQLSGGELQLVSIARAIVRRPRVILADEPTGSVNVATGRRIMALLGEVLKEAGSAMVLVTHNPEDAAKADRVVFLKDGRIDGAAHLTGEDVTVARIHQRLQELGI
jgi:putative ABC transport system ATP-binding protein